MNDLKKSIDYSEIVGEIYNNIQIEFEMEISEAYTKLKNEISTNN